MMWPSFTGKSYVKIKIILLKVILICLWFFLLQFEKYGFSHFLKPSWELSVNSNWLDYFKAGFTCLEVPIPLKLRSLCLRNHPVQIEHFSKIAFKLQLTFG